MHRQKRLIVFLLFSNTCYIKIHRPSAISSSKKAPATAGAFFAQLIRNNPVY